MVTQLEGASNLLVSCVDCASFPCSGDGFLQVLGLHPTVLHNRLTGESDLAIGVILSLHCCLSICVIPVLDW